MDDESLLRDSQRAEVIESLGLDCAGSLQSPALNYVVRCAARTLNGPMAMVALVGNPALHIVARLGIVSSEPRAKGSFCLRTLAGGALLEIPDTAKAPEFSRNPLVMGEPFVRWYAGVPLVVSGRRIGVLCVLDRRPRRLSEAEASTLSDLAAVAAACLEARREHLELRQARQDSSMRLQTLEQLSALVPGMWLQYESPPGAEGRIRFISQHAAQIMGLNMDPDPAAGFAAVLDSVHPEDRSSLEAAFRSAASPSSAWRQDFRVRMPDGSVQWRCVQARPSSSAGGRVLWHAYVNDIDAQVTAETLRQEKGCAERASAEKSKLLSRISHELRNPLNAMLGFMRLLLDDGHDPLSERQRQRVLQAHRAAQLQLGLINDLLDFGRIEHGKVQLDPSSLSLAEVIDVAVAMVKEQADAMDVHISVTTPMGGDPRVLADRRALEQVVLNLLSNGIKYNRRGGALSVKLGAVDGQACIEVADQGPGLSAEQIARLFRPFERLNAAASNIPGTGLGLLISKELVEAMGGSIGIQSQPGQGSTFIVLLPLRPPTGLDTTVAERRPELDLAREGQGASAISARILHIDADPVNAMLVRESLRVRPDWRLTHAASGRAGLALAQELRPQMLLVDVNLSDMTAADVVRAIRSDPRTEGAQCIALSADATTHRVEDALHADFDALWTKPIDVMALPARIKRLLAQTRLTTPRLIEVAQR